MTEHEKNIERLTKAFAKAADERDALKARLEAVVKELEDMRKYCAFACVDTEDVDVILRAARGEGGAE